MEICLMSFGRVQSLWTALALLAAMSLLALGLLFSENNRKRYRRET